MRLLDRLFGRKSGKSQLESTSPPEDFLAEVKNLNGCEVLLKALEESKQYKRQSLPERLRVWFAISTERLSLSPPPNDDVDRITQAILDISGMYKYGNFDLWYEEILRDLPLNVKTAVIDAVERRTSDNQYELIDLDLVKALGGERAESFFANLRQSQIARAKSEHLSDWNLLLSKVEELPIVSADEADRFLKEDSPVWKAGRAFHFFNIEDLLYEAVSRTVIGNFSALVENAEIRSEPIPHLFAPYGWYQADDAYGTNLFCALRIGENEFLCEDKESCEN